MSLLQMPAAPPSYDQAVGGGGLYPQVPEKGGLGGPPGPPGPPAANYHPPNYPQQPTQVVTQVQYVQAPTFGYRPVNMTCPHCQNNITTRSVRQHRHEDSLSNSLHLQHEV